MNLTAWPVTPTPTCLCFEDGAKQGYSHHIDLVAHKNCSCLSGIPAARIPRSRRRGQVTDDGT